MVALKSLALVLLVAAVSAVPTPDPVLFKKSDGLRYQYREDGLGNNYLVDQWYKLSDAKNAFRYNPDSMNIYHLFTRQNPSVSQPMFSGSTQLLLDSNYNPDRRTVFLVHGWTQSGTSEINSVLVNAFLTAADVNVFVVDWSQGAGILDLNGPENAVASGYSLARAIDWVISTTGASINNFHLVGFSLGAHQVAVAGRNVQSGKIPYITALDPGANMEESGHMFSPDCATYTESIHTNALIMGHGQPVAHSDFYPNGGDNQPGCGLTSFLCNHYRSYWYFSETLTQSGGFSAVRCQTYAQARLGLCFSILPNVRMGGLLPKFGTQGIFHLTTNAESPFSP